MDKVGHFLSRFYWQSVAVILLVTAVIKFISVGYEVGFLGKTDPVFMFLTNRQMILIAAIFEFAIACFLFSRSSLTLKMSAIAWVATVFFAYHVGIRLTGYLGPCKCLGGSLDWLTKSQAVVNNVPRIILGYLLCSYLFIVAEAIRRLKINTAVRASVITILSVGCIGKAQALDQFEVAGNMDFSAYNANGSPYIVLHYDFDVCVSNDQWFVKTVWPKSYSVEHGGDGKSVYGVIYDPSSGIGIRPADITSGMYPLIMDPYNRVLWLAFASSSYISSITNNNMPAPWGSAFKNPLVYAYGVEVERSKIAPGIPIHLTFIANKELISSAANNINLDNPSKIDVDLLSDIQPGFIGGEYIAKETTNYDGLEIPTEFGLMQYRIGSNSLSAKWSGHVTKISSNQRGSYLPKIPDLGIGVTDYRFRDKSHDVTYINYRLTNENWLAQSDPGLQLIFAQQTSRQVEAPKQYLSRKAVAVLMLLVFIIPPLIAVYLTILKHKTNKKQTSKG